MADVHGTAGGLQPLNLLSGHTRFTWVTCKGLPAASQPLLFCSISCLVCPWNTPGELPLLHDSPPGI